MLFQKKFFVLLMGLGFLLSSCASTNTSTGADGDKIPVTARITNKFQQNNNGEIDYYVTLYYFASPRIDKSDKNGDNETLSEVLEDIGEGIKNAGKEIGRSDDLTSTNVMVSRNQYDEMEVGDDVDIYYSSSNKKDVSFQ